MLLTYSALPLEQCEADLNKPSKTLVGSSQPHPAFCPLAELNFLQPLESLLPLRPAISISSIWGTLSSLWLTSRDLLLLYTRSGSVASSLPM